MRSLRELTAPEKGVLVLAALTVVLGLANLGRAVVAVRYAAQIPELQTRMPLAYAVGTGLFWGAALVVCAGGLFAARAWGRWSALLGVTLYQAHVWLNRLCFDASDYARQTRPRDLVLTGGLLLLYWGTLNLRPVRRVFCRDARADDQDRSQARESGAPGKEIYR